jgi:hypothetical protein
LVVMDHNHLTLLSLEFLFTLLASPVQLFASPVQLCSSLPQLHPGPYLF